MIVVGSIQAIIEGLFHATASNSPANILIADPQLDNAYYAISHVEFAWWVPGAVIMMVGVGLLVASRKLGSLLAHESKPEE